MRRSIKVFVSLIIMLSCSCSKDDVRAAYKELKSCFSNVIKDADELQKQVDRGNDAMDSAKDSAREAKQLYDDAKDKVEKTGDEARQTVNESSRKMPHSEKEANRMVQSRGRQLMLWMRETMKGFKERHQRGLINERRLQEPKR